MKIALLSMAAVIALAGVQGASVEGNNTAVVIRRDNKASSTGYQLLCVPVCPFDITGTASETAEIPLKELLPPVTYQGCTVTVNVGETDSKAYTASGDSWTLQDNANNGEEPKVQAGDVLWFKNPKDQNGASEYVSGEGDPVIFCGQEKITNAVPVESAGIASIGNATTQNVTLAELFGEASAVTRSGARTFQAGDQMYRIDQRGDKDYTYYFYDGAEWWTIATNGQMSKVDLTTVQIVPGEALYYHLGGISAQN